MRGGSCAVFWAWSLETRSAQGRLRSCRSRFSFDSRLRCSSTRRAGPPPFPAGSRVRHDHDIAPDDIVRDARRLPQRARAAAGARAAAARSSTRTASARATSSHARSARATRNVTYLIERGGQRGRAAPPAAPAAAAERARRAARGAPAAARCATRRRACRRCWRCARTRDAIGCPFYVMERIEGEVIVGERARARSTRPPSAGAIAEQLIDALVEIHARRLARGGPRGLRQADRLSGAPAAALLGLWELNKTREIPAVERVGGWLAEHLPESGRRRRSCTATTASATRSSPPQRPGAPGGRARLGDGDDRRPAGRHRLPVHDVDRGRRPGRRAARSSSATSRAPRASPPAPS